MTAAEPNQEASALVVTKLVRGTNSALRTALLEKYLPLAKTYCRAVGYFSSSVFDAAPSEFDTFFNTGGRMEVVCSPVFSYADLQTLHAAIYSNRHSPRIDWTKVKVCQDALYWAVRNDRLEIKIAMFDAFRHHGIFHEKTGIMELKDGRIVAVEGSANETSHAYRANFERVLVHECQGDSPNQFVCHIRHDFERLWGNATPGLQVVSLHQAFVSALFEVRDAPIITTNSVSQLNPQVNMKAPVEILKLPSRLRLREYQQLAIRRWFEAGGRGIFSMATGSGKTITALAVVEELYRRAGSPLVVIIVAPYLNLAEQWIKEATNFGLMPINCTGSRADWVSLVKSAIYLNETNHRPILSLVTTNSSFSLDPFQQVLSRLRVRTILVADEVHNLGARHLSHKLPQKINLRLGLSATPERWMDEEGTQAIKDYFGQVVFDFDLRAALSGPDPTLCPYIYHPILVTLDEEEIDEYLSLTKRLARIMVDPQLENLSNEALALLLRRSRLLASAKNKLPALARCVAPYKNTRFNLIYCGDGRVEVDEVDSKIAKSILETEILKQVDAVTKLLGQRLGMNVAKYTSETSPEERRTILQDFTNGDKQALVAIRCLDEGVDIPEVRRAFILASSTNPRQFIQRRGRVLRKAIGKESAEIFDFIVVPPIERTKLGSHEYATIRKLVEREMNRVVEFASLATNGPQAIGKLRNVLEQLKLLHLL